MPPVAGSLAIGRFSGNFCQWQTCPIKRDNMSQKHAEDAPGRPGCLMVKTGAGGKSLR
jgi:hypothetical protein